MNDDFFYGPKLKIEGANQHIAELEREFDAFYKTSKNALFNGNDPEAGENSWTFGDKLPRHVPSVMGDAVHNLRAALDHFFALCVTANGGALTRNTTFPFHKDRTALEGSLKGLKMNGSAPADSVIKFILDVVQPYPQGHGAALYELHRLDIVDKHSGLINVVQHIHFIEAFFEHGGYFKNVQFSTHGSHPPMPMFTHPSRLQPYADNKIRLKIIFGDGMPFAGRAIVPTLSDLSEHISSVIGYLKVGPPE